MFLTRLTPEHARDAARLHIQGQPGTFLTSLGPDVLTVLYRALPQAKVGFGFAAVDQADGSDAVGSVRGFVSATTSTGGLFLDLGLRRLREFAPPLLACFVRHPSLAVRSLQTLAYPLLVREEKGLPPAAELLSIMVEPADRGRGIGALLLQVLLQECRNRHIKLLDVTVDASNPGARRFYERHGFTLMRQFTLYGRAMCLYRRPV